MRQLGLVLAALIVFLGGMVFANAQTEIFTGCLTPGGDLKNVALGDTPAGDCKGNSLQVSWNAEGQVGPQGPEGPQGPSGPNSPVEAVYSVLTPGENEVVSFDNGFSLELRCATGGGIGFFGEVWVHHVTQWYDNSVAGLVAGPDRLYGSQTAQTSLQIKSVQAYATGLDGAVFQIDRLDIIMPAWDWTTGDTGQCIFGGFTAAG